MKKMSLFRKFHNGDFSKRQLKEIEEERERRANIEASQEVQEYYKYREKVSNEFINILQPIKEALTSLDGRDNCKVADKVLDMYWEYLQKLSEGKNNLNREQSSLVYDKNEFSEDLITNAYSFKRNNRPNNTNTDMLDLIDTTEEIVLKVFPGYKK